MDPSPQVPSETAGRTDALRWRPFAWWRTVLAVVPVCALVVVALPLLGRPQDELWGWAFLGWLHLAVPALFVALPSAFIASYAHRRRRGAVYTALVHDAVILAIALRAIAGTVRNEFGFGQAAVTYDVLPWIGAGATFGTEAAYLLRVAFRWRFAWPALAVLVVGATSVAIAMPPVIAARRLAHVRPLLRYADAHWFAIPQEAKITVGRSYTRAGHIDTVTVVGEDAWWTVRATHDRTGRWVRAGSDSDPAGFPERAGKEAHVEVRTRDDARRVLMACGVPDRALRFQDVTLSPASKDITAYQFWSPLARTRYEVYVQGDVRLVWQQPLDLDQPERRK